MHKNIECIIFIYHYAQNITIKLIIGMGGGGVFNFFFFIQLFIYKKLI